MRALVRFFRKSVVEHNNPYGINPDIIIIGGYSAGGIIANYGTYLDQVTEIPDNLKTYVETQGGLEGNSGNSGYSSKTQIAVSLCGAIGDTSWINKNDQPFIGLHNSNDIVVPNISGFPLTAGGVPLNLKIYGDSAIYLRAKHLNIPTAYKSELSTNAQTSFHCDFSADALDFVTESLYDILCENKNQTAQIIETEQVHFSLYPNPSYEDFHIAFSPDISVRKLTVINAIGQFVFSADISDAQTTFLLKASELDSGIYTVQLHTENGQMGVQKMIVP